MVRRRRRISSDAPHGNAVYRLALRAKRGYCMEKHRWEAATRNPSSSDVPTPPRLPVAVDDTPPEPSSNPEEPAKNKSSDHAWLDFGWFCHSREIHPVRYIRAQFENLGLQDRPIHPKQLMHSSYEARYWQYIAEYRSGAQTEFNSWRQIVATRMRTFQGEFDRQDLVWLAAMTRSNPPFSDLFVYCLSRWIRDNENDSPVFQRLMDSRETGAALDYMRDPSIYDEIWGDDWLPEGWRAYAASVYAQFYMTELIDEDLRDPEGT